MKTRRNLKKLTALVALAVGAVCTTGGGAAFADTGSTETRKIYHNEGWSTAAQDLATQANTVTAESTGSVVTHQGKTITFGTRASECGACHQKIYREWRYAAGSDTTPVGQGTYHARSSTDPMYTALLATVDPTQQSYCRGCHEAGNPWAVVDKINNIPAPRTTNVEEGVNCISCHFDGKRIIDDDYLSEPLFCASCHNESTGLVETYVEWQTDYRGGKTCQGCHMQNESHLFLGFNSPSFIKKAVTISEPSLPTTVVAGTPFSINYTLTNSGAGHAVPSDLLRMVRARVAIDDSTGKQVYANEAVYYKRRPFAGENPAETVVIKAGEIKPVAINGVTIATPGIYTVKIELFQDSNRLMPDYNTTTLMTAVYKTIVVE